MKELSFDISYVSNLPLLGDSPKVTIRGNFGINKNETFKVCFIDFDKKEIVTIKTCKLNETIFGDRQWYTNWLIEIYDSSGILIYLDKMDLVGKKVFIKIDAYALGDNIAWMPYIERFRVKHNCHVICSTFKNNLFEKEYPNILFVAPNTYISNVYAQYYIGANANENVKYCPIISERWPLQFLASKALGLYDVEAIPKISSTDYIPNYGRKYVCLSEHASSEKKSWKAEGGWQFVVDFLNKMEYKVVVISKEPTALKNVINKTGEISLEERVQDIKYSNFFMGISSGLSWVAWALGVHVIMISDCTPYFHEFKSNMTRIGGENLSSVDYNTNTITAPKVVINKIKHLNFFK